MKKSFADLSLKAVFTASVAATLFFGYKATQEMSDIKDYSDKCWVEHNGKNPLSVSQDISQPGHIITAEEKQILSEGETILNLWKHEKAMHGFAILGLIGTMASGAALGFRKMTR